MLKSSMLYEHQLQEEFAKIMFDENFMYADPSVYRDAFEASKSTWLYHEFASVGLKNEVIGYIRYKISRETNGAMGVQIINFNKGKFSTIFGKDLILAIDDIFTKFNFNILRFSVVIGNPAEKMYDKYLHRIGGRVVGIYTKDARLLNGELHDVKIYEVARESYLKIRKK